MAVPGMNVQKTHKKQRQQLRWSSPAAASKHISVYITNILLVFIYKQHKPGVLPTEKKDKSTEWTLQDGS